jgi:hypothetical protein
MKLLGIINMGSDITDELLIRFSAFIRYWRKNGSTMRQYSTYSQEVHIGKHLPNSFPIQNGLKQGDVLSPLLFKFPIEYASRKVQENQVGLKLNGTHQLLAYADYVNLLGDDIDTINNNTETLIETSKGVGLEIKVQKTKYMFTILSPECRSKSGHTNSKQIF